jgi:hypothetical protein
VGRAYETLRVGQAGVEGYVWDVRLVRDRTEKSQHYVVSATALLGPFESVATAMAYCATTWQELAWREDLQVERDEAPCPVCTAPRRANPRYPLALCQVCVLETVDAKGQDVRFYNTTPMGGGFEARHADGRNDDDHTCLVRGVPCRADEAYFGGIVVESLGPRGTKPTT